jgi:hypothetical protein
MRPGDCLYRQFAKFLGNAHDTLLKNNCPTGLIGLLLGVGNAMHLQTVLIQQGDDAPLLDKTMGERTSTRNMAPAPQLCEPSHRWLFIPMAKLLSVIPSRNMIES